MSPCLCLTCCLKTRGQIVLFQSGVTLASAKRGHRARWSEARRPEVFRRARIKSVAASASGPSSSRFGATRQPAWTPRPSPVRFLRESLAGGTWAEAPIRRWSHLRCRERLAPLSLLGEGGTAGGMRRSTAPPSWSGRSLAVDWPNCWALSVAAAALVLISAQCALGRRAIRPAFPGVPLPGCQRQRPTA